MKRTEGKRQSKEFKNNLQRLAPKEAVRKTSNNKPFIKKIIKQEAGQLISPAFQLDLTTEGIGKLRRMAPQANTKAYLKDKGFNLRTFKAADKLDRKERYADGEHRRGRQILDWMQEMNPKLQANRPAILYTDKNSYVNPGTHIIHINRKKKGLNTALAVGHEFYHTKDKEINSPHKFTKQVKKNLKRILKNPAVDVADPETLKMLYRRYHKEMDFEQRANVFGNLIANKYLAAIMKNRTISPRGRAIAKRLY